MTLHTSHPMHLTGGRERVWSNYKRMGYAFRAPIRRIASAGNSRVSVMILCNRAGLTRSDWSASLTIGILTIALVKL